MIFLFKNEVYIHFLTFGIKFKYTHSTTVEITGNVRAWKRIETDINGSYIMLNVFLLNRKSLKHFPCKVLMLHIVNRTNCID